MALCRFCGIAFSWGSQDGKWIPLIPVGQEENVARTYQDENGNLRSEHRAICTNQGGPSVRIARLVTPVDAKDVIQQPKKCQGKTKARRVR